MLTTNLCARRPYLSLLQAAVGCSVATQASGNPRRSLYTTNALAHAPPTPQVRPRAKPALARLPRLEENSMSNQGFQQLQNLLRSYKKSRLLEDAERLIQSYWQLNTSFPSYPSHIPRKVIDRLLTSDTPEYAIEYLRLAYALHEATPPTLGLFDRVCAAFGKRRQWEVVAETVQLASEQREHLNAKLFEWKAQACLETKNYGGLRAILEEARQSGIRPNRSTFRAMLTGALRNSDLAQAQQVKQEMEAQGCPEVMTHGRIARAYKTLGPDDDAEEKVLSVLSQMTEPQQVGVLNGLIYGHMVNGNVQPASRLLSLFEPKSVEIIIELLCGNDGGRDMLYNSPSYPKPLPKPPSPDAKTFSIFIHHCSHQKNLSGALQLLQSMLYQGVALDDRVVTSLVQACFSCGRQDLGVQLVANACNTDATPFSLFRPFHPGPWPANRFEVHIPDMPPSTRLLNALIQGILPTHGISGAKGIIDIMRLAGLQPDERTLDLLLSHLFFVERAHPRTLLNLLHSIAGPHLRPSEKHMRVVLRSIQAQEELLLHGRGWNSMKLFIANRQVPAERLTTSTSSFDDFAGLLPPMFRKYRQLAEPFLQNLRDRGIKPDYATVGLRIRHEAVINMDMSAAADVFRTMLSRGMRPNAYHYGALMEGYALKGDVKNTRGVFESAKRAGVVPDVILYTILITANTRRGTPHQAVQVFQEMLNAGIRPDVASIDALACAFYAQGSNSTAKRILISLWPYIEEFPVELQDKPVLELASEFRSRSEHERDVQVKLSKQKEQRIHFQLGELLKTCRQSAPKEAQPKSTWSEVIASHRRPSPLHQLH